MAGEDSDQREKSDDVLKDIPRNNEQKLHRHCEKTLDEDASYLERTSKRFSWQSPNVEITSFLLITLRMVLLFLRRRLPHCLLAFSERRMIEEGDSQ
jgi:hypothetical protein